MNDQKLEHTIVIIDQKGTNAPALIEHLDEGSIVLRADKVGDSVAYILAKLGKTAIETLPSGIQLT